MSNNIIDRYVFAVGNQLSGKDRDDIQLELRSTLQDMLEERGLDVENTKDTKKISEMLKEFGSPKSIASSYHPQQYLIGPRYFPIYAQVVKIVSRVIFGVVALGAFLGWSPEQNPLEQMAGLFWNYGAALFQSIAIVTLIFFIVERSGVADDELEAEQNKNWDPQKLPAIMDMDRVNYFEVIVELLFGLGFLFFLNAVFGAVGPQAQFIQNWEHAPDILEKLARFLPYLAALFGLEVLLKLYVLIRGGWAPWTRWLEFGLSAADSILVVFILAQGPFSDLVWLDVTVRASLWIALLILGGTGMAQLYRLLRPKQKPPWINMRAGAQSK